LLFIIASFGIYYFWYRVKKRTELCSRISLNDQSFEYRGQAKDHFNSFLKFIRVFGTLLIAFEYGKDFYPIVKESLTICQFFTVMIGYISAHYYNLQLQLSETYWKGKTISTQSNYLDYVSVFLHWTLLSLLSVGLLAPVRHYRLLNLRLKSLSLDGQAFEFSGDVKTFTRMYLTGLVLSVVTLGVYWSWHQAEVQNYQWNHLKVGALRFRSILKGSELFWLNLETIFLLLLTLGFAWPWVSEIRLQMRMNRLAVVTETEAKEVKDQVSMDKPDTAIQSMELNH
jgi:uncharacterized membrane protein YjgN (DUF898 family)